MARTPGQQAWFDRHEVAATWLTKADFAEFRRQAMAKGVTVSTHMRNILLVDIKAQRAAALTGNREGEK
jgi:hypothetical protein